LFEIFNTDFLRAAIGGAGMVGVINVGYMLVSSSFPSLLSLSFNLKKKYTRFDLVIVFVFLLLKTIVICLFSSLCLSLFSIKIVDLNDSKVGKQQFKRLLLTSLSLTAHRQWG
jgi:hypothetical protein